MYETGTPWRTANTDARAIGVGLPGTHVGVTKDVAGLLSHRLEFMVLGILVSEDIINEEVSSEGRK